MYRKGAVHIAEIEGPFFAGKGLNTNLVHFVPLYHVIMSNVHIYYFTGTISNVHGCAPKTILHAQNPVYKKL